MLCYFEVWGSEGQIKYFHSQKLKVKIVREGLQKKCAFHSKNLYTFSGIVKHPNSTWHFCVTIYSPLRLWGKDKILQYFKYFILYEKLRKVRDVNIISLKVVFFFQQINGTQQRYLKKTLVILMKVIFHEALLAETLGYNFITEVVQRK